MNYGEILATAWKITWKNKVLVAFWDPDWLYSSGQCWQSNFPDHDAE